MPNPDYLGAAAWCRDEMTSVYPDTVEYATLALSCVRAMQALAEGRVVVEPPGLLSPTDWNVFDRKQCRWFTAPDPLTAITLALTEAGDA